jgi:hypothetical protein
VVVGLDLSFYRCGRNVDKEFLRRGAEEENAWMQRRSNRTMKNIAQEGI